MKNDLQKEALNRDEIIPAEDILSDEMAEAVEGGKIRICISGKIINDESMQSANDKD